MDRPQAHLAIIGVLFRAGAAADRLPGRPAHVVTDLAPIPELAAAP
mgnify:CR=1 FL=1